MVSSSYPAQIDTSFLITAVDNITPVDANIANRLRASILAIQLSLGLSPAGIYSTVAARLNALENLITNVQAISLGGDIGGTTISPLVIGIQGRPVSSTAPLTGEALIWGGSAWVPTVPSLIESVVTPIKTSAYTPAFGETVRVNPTSGAFAINLLGAAGEGGKFVAIKNVSSSTNAVTLTPAFGETIDGQSTWVMAIGFQSIELLSDGSNWAII